VQPDAFNFDPRPPVQMPSTGSGYGSGVMAPTGRSPMAPTGPMGQADDATVMDWGASDAQSDIGLEADSGDADIE